ncbi:MAG: DUF3747 domain-containing protein [Spirulinaceae cyanobacterium]
MWKNLLSLLLLGSAVGLLTEPAIATPFGNQRIDERRFVLVASPFGIRDRSYQLLILEQIPGRRTCWQEYGSSPTQVDPLLLTFDFTNSCKRMTDSNGYSVRVGSEDLSWRFILSLVERNNQLVLVANSARERNVEMEIGRTQGVVDGYLKIELDPGWSLTRRTYNGRALDHLYLTGDPQVVTVPTNTRPPIGSTPGALPPVDEEIIIQPLPPRDSGSQPPRRPTPQPQTTPSDDLPPLPPPPPQRRIP